MTDLKTIRGVEILKTGTWDASTGPWTVTREQLRSAVDAHAAGVIRRPVIKLGHDDPRFDGGPSFGYLDNLRLADGGKTLVADMCSVPAWLAKAIPSHYPDRSVEGMQDLKTLYPDRKIDAHADVKDTQGTTWPLVITGVALLGATAPAVTTLESLQQLVAAKSVTIAASFGTTTTGRPRDRAVTVAAARRRRTYRKVTLT
ncbi:hypothetical protein OG579_13675 [Williamsia herbipolensis]|uniref:Uncharacterized protein n=1 Tax=Williamsia herbipolensis TaxID=1603258 RepID=A0AAU4JYB6_9NOCA|nr:hypothetical protein [Williamsia herbipolensis]